jgi:hypothetical protein
MAQFGLIKPFDIDHGELDELSRQQCFVLGYELAQIDFLLKQRAAICKPVNADNSERIEKACAKSGRSYRLEWMQCDSSEAWMTLSVAPLENEDAAS